jgi:5-methylcytosine-specific restriction endonuclease McrA
MLNNLRRKKEIKLKGFKDKIECFRKKMSEIGECIYCGSKENITIEHLIPISKGGTHEVYNLFPACRKCNSSKHAQDWIEWYRKQIFYSKDKENKILKMCC